MARRFRGESVHKVDQKGRVSIPAPFRRVLEEGDPDWVPGANPNLVLIYGLKGGRCIEGYSLKGIDELDEEISGLPRYSPEREAWERMINTDSVYAQVDENGRMVLSQKLRDTAGITDEAVFAGMGERFQIWNPDAYADDKRRVADWLGAQGGEGDLFAALDGRRGG